ncbi:hypothetical protein DCAR_0934318 [Daucus carota subsp. sativus]|uniref:WPP domain-containing protein n=1 Tax=Daucus carota subsp. sativus TaxID=79200 RepID=A0AAF1BCY4_DAUCS|nr:hypothetical protein DCAR_0934318 [Daucus carota subsp. sativus]
MAEIDDKPSQPSPSISKSPVTYAIWPPSQRTCNAVTKRLLETLSSPSVISKRYDTLPEEKARVIAAKIEGEAFATAFITASPDDDGIEILQGYESKTLLLISHAFEACNHFSSLILLLTSKTGDFRRPLRALFIALNLYLLSLSRIYTLFPKSL